MKNLKRLGAAVVLTCALGVAAFAGELPTSPCPPPDPGETHSPPCAAAPTSGDPGETSSPPASSADGVSITEIAADLLQSVLSIF